ncbi:LPS export ABC transporter ATP-binding protein [bacterium]|jgi:lipopolysaccharide export system ATP-binding protein|nr:LPS export ABC transporter ATP-binding protein [bacterium]MBT3581236.1 LPS export ABC transporter ATP-binding protein [bacterium]MBT4552349.1 LPS export ABC transporter ATP-binding protein [bacterium]MBT5988981.1 LPS export ABC transporter ATP-binding protein [bacterium]MBT7087869.1 LPS export ABC transporter ATP-binding protein [bacterium]
MIETKKLVKIYKNRKVVNDVNLTMKRGEIVGLLGPNGAGKTTTFYMIVGLVRPNQGEVYFDSQNITHLPMHQRSRLGIGYLPQEPSIFKKLTVEENILVLWEILKNVSPQNYQQKLDELLEEMGIIHLKKAHGYELSGGEKRRVEIVRALATNPSYILLDEPFAGIDPITITEIQEILQKLKKKNLGIIITDHNVRETLSITDRAYIIHEGKLLLSGSSEEIANDPIAKKLYLGNNFKLT